MPANNNQVTLVAIAKLRKHPKQDENFSPVSSAEEASFLESIRKEGIRHPIEIIPPKNRAGLRPFTIIGGHRRLAAAIAAGLKRVPTIIRHDLIDADAESVELALISDNLERRQLSVVEIVLVTRRMIALETKKNGHLTPANLRMLRGILAKRFGWSEKTASRYIALAEAPPEIANAVSTNHLTLVLGARVGGLPEAAQMKLKEELVGKDAKVISSIVKRFLGISANSRRHQTLGNARASFIHALAHSVLDLSERDLTTPWRATKDDRKTLVLAKEIIEKVIAAASPENVEAKEHLKRDLAEMHGK
jgi:ParB/RepB/Spo0J family partition protein